MNAVLIVFTAEFMRRLRSRPYLIGLGIGILVLLGVTKLPALLVGMIPASADRVVVIATDQLGARVDPLLRADYTIAATLRSPKPDAAMLHAYNADTAIAVTARAASLAVTVYAKDPGGVSASTIRRDLLPLQLQRVTGLPAPKIAAAVMMPVEIHAIASKFRSSQEEEAADGVVYMLLFFLYITILLNSQLVMSSVAEEKTSRIAELLISSIDPTTLLVGKIAAGTALALVQLALWLVCGLLFGSDAANGAAAVGPNIGLSALVTGDLLSPLTIGAFLAFFLIGLLQLSTLFAGIASMINRTEDIGSVNGPLVLPVMFALFLAFGAIGAPDAPWAVAAGFLPIVSPFVMFARIAVGIVPAWQIAFSLGINLVALGAIAWGAGRIYRVGMLFYGRAPSLRQIWKALRTE